MTGERSFTFELTEADTRLLARGEVPPGLAAYARIEIARADRNDKRGIAVPTALDAWKQHQRVQQCKAEKASAGTSSSGSTAVALGEAPGVASEPGSIASAGHPDPRARAEVPALGSGGSAEVTP